MVSSRPIIQWGRELWQPVVGEEFGEALPGNGKLKLGLDLDERAKDTHDARRGKQHDKDPKVEL